MATPAPAKASESSVPVRRMADDPFSLIRSAFSDMERFFNDFALRPRWPLGLFGTREAGVWSPAIEVEQRDNMLKVRADLPGLTSKDVKVEVTEDTLTIEGERKHSEEKREGGYYRSERSYGQFFRSIALPEGAKPETAKATFKDGVLEVTIETPEAPKRSARQVQIES